MADILVAGLDCRSLLLEAPVLQRQGGSLEEKATVRDLLDTLARNGARCVVLGSLLPDQSLDDAIKKIRSLPATRHGLDPGRARLRRAGRGGGGRPGRGGQRRPAPAPGQRQARGLGLQAPRGPAAGGRAGARAGAGGGHAPHREDRPLLRPLAQRQRARHAAREPGEAAGGPRPRPRVPASRRASRVKALGRVVREAVEVGWPYIGYGVEFLFVPDESRMAIGQLVDRETRRCGPPPAAKGAACSTTVRRGTWIYEIVQPVPYEGASSPRSAAAREGWRPGVAGPYYVVEAASADAAVRAARAFVNRQE